MPDPGDKPSSTESPPPAGGDPNASRRRLLQGGLAAAPVLMTLVSRPVLSQGSCTTPSGFVSANASMAGRGVTCSGHAPTYWANSQHLNEWPSAYFPTKVTGPGGHNPTYFKDVFKPNLSASPTLLEVLAITGNPTNDVARYVVAALLNAAAGLAPVLSISLVKDIWSEFASTGSFSPSSGAHWNSSEIIAYLSTTMQ